MLSCVPYTAACLLFSQLIFQTLPGRLSVEEETVAHDMVGDQGHTTFGKIDIWIPCFTKF